MAALDADADGAIGLMDWIAFAARLKEYRRREHYASVMATIRTQADEPLHGLKRAPETRANPDDSAPQQLEPDALKRGSSKDTSALARSCREVMRGEAKPTMNPLHEHDGALQTDGDSDVKRSARIPEPLTAMSMSAPATATSRRRFRCCFSGRRPPRKEESPIEPSARVRL